MRFSLRGRPKESRSGPATVRIALLGNPNAGKTLLFNRLTGLSQKVGNYPGVTVERKEGSCGYDGLHFTFLDLPGTYSLAAHSPDETLAVDILLGRRPDVPRPEILLDVVDASNLERNLYLTSQALETGLPLVIALTMVDVARARGVVVDTTTLSLRLGVPVVAVEAHRGIGIDTLKAAIASVARAPRAIPREGSGLPLDAMDAEVRRFANELEPAFAAAGIRPHPVELRRAILDRSGHAERRLVEALGEGALERLEAVRKALSICMPLAAYEATHRYAWIRKVVEGCIARRSAAGNGGSERLDRVLTHRVWGIVIFALIMLAVFQSIFVGAKPLMLGLESVFANLQDAARTAIPPGAFQSLVADGILAGVGMVLMFLPQILVLFLFIGLLEDCGYMARAAFLMDKVMSHCGLSGKSFIPMLSGFACAIPGILGARVIEDRRDRLATMLVIPLMSCSARLPVYAVFLGSFVPDRVVIPGILGIQAVVFFALYSLGILIAIAVAWVLRRTLLAGARPPFVLELPGYKWPNPGSLFFRLWERARSFLARAGSVILAMAVIVWALAYFPRSEEVAREFETRRAAMPIAAEGDPGRAAVLDRLAREEAAAALEVSYFGQIGKIVGPVFAPLGWDWRISVAVLSSFPAREVLVSSLGTIFQLGGEVDETSAALRDELRAARRLDDPSRPLFSLPVALSVLVFFALCCQCGATVVTLAREAGSWGWAVFGFGYMSALAYLGALLVYQVSSALAT